jgi:hypothetical protein|tara:strand:+ start:19 stop:396 length:378 start_codon:yes stop_codon:yes gene_type:complete
MSDISLEQWHKKLALLSDLTSPQKQNIPWGELGLTLTEKNDYLENLILLFVIIDRSWRKPFTVKSDFARVGALHVAIAASEGFITNQIDEDSWGKRWYVTPDGQDIHEEISRTLKEVIYSPHITH